MNVEQLAVIGAAINLGRGAARKGGAPERHMLIIGLRRSLPPQIEDLGRGAVLIMIARPIIVGLVIVPRHPPTVRRVRGLQIGVQLILRIARAIIIEAVDLVTGMLANDGNWQTIRTQGRRPTPVFVDIVAIVPDEVEFLGGDMAVGSVIAILIILAAAGNEANAIEHCAGLRQRPGATGIAALAARREAIPIGPVGLQAGQFDMNRMSKLGAGELLTFRDDLGEACILGDFIIDREWRHRHAAMWIERPGRQPRPDDEAIRGRIARCDTKRKRLVGEDRLRTKDGRRAHACA